MNGSGRRDLISKQPYSDVVPPLGPSQPHLCTEHCREALEADAGCSGANSRACNPLTNQKLPYHVENKATCS
jgi:hypothetical protein